MSNIEISKRTHRKNRKSSRRNDLRTSSVSGKATQKPKNRPSNGWKATVSWRFGAVSVLCGLSHEAQVRGILVRLDASAMADYKACMKLFRNMGPGMLVTAAFIGPGTVTTASVAGAHYGYALLWAVVFSTVATIIMQEMSARIGLAARMGPAEGLRVSIHDARLRSLALALVILAIGFGNAAFQVGNITGTSIALEAATGMSAGKWAIIVGLAAGVLLYSGTYQRIERILIALVVLMSASFMVTAVLARPHGAEFLSGLRPQMPQGSTLTIIALIGTTVVPYNLFLHANAVQAKWPATKPLESALSQARFDSAVAISIGGAITAAILLTAAAFFQRGALIDSATTMAQQLGPALGPWAKYLFLAGLMAAGFTSAITAPLAAAYATSGALGWSKELHANRFRAVWLTVLIVGTAFAATGRRPIEAIRLAQAFNGLLLPIVAGFLMWVMNRRSLLGAHTNGPLANVLGIIVLATTAALGAVQIGKALGSTP